MCRTSHSSVLRVVNHTLFVMYASVKGHGGIRQLWILVKEVVDRRFLVKRDTHQQLSQTVQPVPKPTFTTV